MAVVSLVVVSSVIWRGLAPTPTPTLAPPTAVPATAIPRWSTRAPMPTSRSGLAVAVYDNQLYAIGGDTGAGVTGAVERYDPENDVWSSLAPKTQSVADVSAGVVGGLIYVPGGRTQSGAVTDVLEVYDPLRNEWDTRAPMPTALSEYAAAVFEGKLYVFGGWNGTAYVALTYAYDPERDEWSERTRMPTPRGLAGATVAGERIYVIGGTDGQRLLDVNEAFTPAQDDIDGQPWRILAPLPDGRSGMGVVTLADTIHVLGGDSSQPGQPPLVYRIGDDSWQSIEAPPQTLPDHPGVVSLGGVISVLADGEHLRYQAIYFVLIPVVAP